MTRATVGDFTSRDVLKQILFAISQLLFRKMTVRERLKLTFLAPRELRAQTCKEHDP